MRVLITVHIPLRKAITLLLRLRKLTMGALKFANERHLPHSLGPPAF